MSGMASPTRTKALGVVEKLRAAALLARSVERRSANIVGGLFGCLDCCVVRGVKWESIDN